MIKNVNKWIFSYLLQQCKYVFKEKDSLEPVHIMFSCVDHFEPNWNNADTTTQINRVERWLNEYKVLASKHKDSDGYSPKHTFFYPAESYVKKHLDMLAEICNKGYGEVEIHLHHDNDTEEGFKNKLIKAKKDFSSHGLLSKRNLSENTRFAFIHGNWALNNSRKDGKWCGVNNESNILSDLGCYADYTFPSAPSETQTSKINSIYYTSSKKDKPKTHNFGINAKVGTFSGAELMIIQGPLALNWKRRKNGVFPRIENGEISGVNPPTKDRVDLWIRQRISVKGKPDWIFVKVYTHGAPEKNADVLLGKPTDDMFSYLETKYNDGNKFVLHYVSAREMYNIIKAAEAGENGSPGQYRDYIIKSGWAKDE